MNYTEQSDLYFSFGITTIPCEAKKPLKKSGYQELISGPTPNIQPDYGTPNGLAALCGSYSSGLVVMDFDLKNAYGEDIFEEYISALNEDNPRLNSFLCYFKTPSGGYKIPFFSDSQIKTDCFAKNEEGKPLIEIQGEKALSMVPPSEGYEWVVGNITCIPSLNQSEVDYLLSLARCYSQYSEPEIPAYSPKGTRIAGDSPLNKFDSDTDLTEWLTNLGWKVLKANSGQVHLNRPEAKNKKGVDATIYREKGVLRIWSTSSDLVPDIERTYKPSQLLVFTKYNGDFSQAARELALQYNLTPYNPNPNASITKLPVRPVKGKEHRFIPDNPALKLQASVFEAKLRGLVKDNCIRGVHIADVMINNIHEMIPEIDKEEIQRFAEEYYSENEDEFATEGKKYSGFEVAEKFINKNYIIRRNSVLLTTEILNRKDATPTGYNIDSIWNTLQGKGVKINRAQIVSLCNDPRIFELYDPFEEYFKNVKFNGTGFIDQLSAYVLVEDGVQDFWKTMFRKALIRTVAGAIGEYPNREALVLCSPKERIGKTQFVRFLCPWGPNKYYSDEPVIQSKDQTFRVAQNLIYLIDEIGAKSVNEKMADFLKMLISKQTINERRVYDVDTTNMTRKVTFWGTSNKPYLYRGENSRWITIPIVAINHDYCNYKTQMQEVSIDDVWAEAYHAYIEGEEFELTDAERDRQAQINADWYIGNEAVGLIDSYVRFSDNDWLSAEEIINRLVIVNPSIARRISAANIQDAMKSRAIPTRTIKTEAGYKIAQYRCKVEAAMPQTDNTNNPF